MNYFFYIKLIFNIFRLGCAWLAKQSDFTHHHRGLYMSRSEL